MVKRNREKREPEKLDSNRQSKTESQEGESRMEEGHDSRGGEKKHVFL